MLTNAEIFNEEMQTSITFALFHKEIITRCCKILEEDYFAKDLKQTVKLVKQFYTQHGDSLPIPIIKSYIQSDYVHETMTESQKNAMLKMIEKFCKHSAIRKVINETSTMLEVGDYGEIESKMAKALSVSLDTDAGFSYFDMVYAKNRIENMDKFQAVPIGYTQLDEVFDGGIGRQELFLILAKSGGGKSLFMLNVGHNFIMRGMDVLYISLELKEDIIMQRYDSMISGYHKLELPKHKQDILNAINNATTLKKYGKFYVKRLPQSTTNSNDIRNCIKSFEIETGKTPDVVAVDYIDLMAPNSASHADNLFIREKYIAEELREVFHEFNTVGISASQYNRTAHTTNPNEISHANIAGGISKINTCDNCIALWQSDEEKARGEYMVKILKSRNSGGVDKTIRLSINTKSLRISDFNENDNTNNLRSNLSLR